MPRECGPRIRWMSPDSGSASTSTPSGSGPPGAADEGVVEADPLGAAVDADRGLRALKDDVLEAEVDAQPVEQRLMAQTPPGTAARAPGAGRSPCAWCASWRRRRPAGRRDQA